MDTETVRRYVGGLAAVVLLSLIVVNFLRDDLTLTSRAIGLLLMLIGMGLGIDLLADKLPVQIDIKNKDGGE